MTIPPQLQRDHRNAAEERLEAPERGTPEHRSSPRPRRRFPAWFRASGAALPIIISALVVVAVGAVALTAFRHGRSSSNPATRTVQSSPSRQELIGLLGVLRRPQTSGDYEADLVPMFFAMQQTASHERHPDAADRPLLPYHDTKLDRPLARTVDIPAWHAKVQIAPFSWQPSLASPRRTEGLALAIGGPDPATGVWGSTTVPPATVDTIRDHGFALMASYATRPGVVMQGVIVVPDGVAKVRLGPFRLNTPPAAARTVRLPSVTFPVRENIAAIQLKVPTVHSTGIKNPLGWDTTGTAQDTWYDASGKVIARTTTYLNGIQLNMVPPAHARHS